MNLKVDVLHLKYLFYVVIIKTIRINLNFKIHAKNNRDMLVSNYF